MYQRQKIEFKDYANNFNYYRMLTREWVIIELDSENQTFFKDHEVILINLQYYSYINKKSEDDNKYRYLQLPDQDGKIIDFKNEVIIDLSTFQSS